MKPGDPYALMWMSRLKLAFGDTDAALDLARKAVGLRPTDTELQVQLGDALKAAMDKVGFGMKQFSLAKEWRQAREVVLTANPSHEQANEDLISYYAAVPALLGGSMSKARELAVRFTQTKPAIGLVLQAKIAFFDKDVAGAKTLLQQAMAKDPASLRVHQGALEFYLQQKPQSLEAIATCCRKALASHPTNSDFHATLANVLALQGKWADLETALAQARRVCSEDLRPLFFAARGLIAANKQLDKAESFLRTYLSQEPEGHAPRKERAHATLAEVFEKTGRRPEAIRELEMALKLDPGYTSASKELKRLQKG